MPQQSRFRVDQRGLPVGTGSAASVQHQETALWRMMAFYDPPIADLDAAIAADPAWAMPHAMKAGFLYSLTEPGVLVEAAAHLDRAVVLVDAQVGGAPRRERAHLEALRLVRDGRWHAACRQWDELLLEYPRDALALQWAHLWDFYRGDSRNLRLRPARSLPEWDDQDPLYPHLLALHAFGLEECNLLAQAEDVGRQALSLAPMSPWAIHAVAHVMEMQGRFDDGAAWLRQHQPAWVANGYAIHLWWHLALFRLEALDEVGVLRLVDAHLVGEAIQITLNRVDAASMLWRLRLIGADVGDRFVDLIKAWPLDLEHAGYSAFNDIHVLIALLGADEHARAEAWLSRCAERVMQPEQARHANQAIAREVGLPVMRALLAYARGDNDAAASALYATREVAQRIGGSHAQRDLIDQTLLAAAALGRRDVGRAVLNERLLAKPLTPLTRLWAERMGVRIATAA
jgi:tetratricopeptide (TPR) repeat protein